MLCVSVLICVSFFFFKQKTAYEMRISDWSSDVCSSDLPADNPFAEKGGVTAQIWSLGHRNLLGIAFDGTGKLWQQEMGPKGGDEVNLVERGANYGYPI